MQEALIAGAIFTAGGEKQGFWANAYPILPHPAELIVGLIAFAIVYAVAAKVAVPAFEKMYAERTAAIEGGMQQAEAAQAEAEALLTQYRAQLADARAESTRLVEEARAQGASIVAAERERAQEEANRILEAAHRQVIAERQQASAQLRGEVGRLATDLASRIVGESLHDEARQSRVVDRFLEDLERTESLNGHATVSGQAF